MKELAPSDLLRIFLLAGLGLSTTACSVSWTESPEEETTETEKKERTERAQICQGPPLTDNGTGFVYCAQGVLHRQEEKACPVYEMREDPVQLPDTGMAGALIDSQCVYDADCEEGRHCEVRTSFFTAPYTVCAFHCTTDADCQNGGVCLCSGNSGSCVSGRNPETQVGCNTDADCPLEEQCLGISLRNPCGAGPIHFVCSSLQEGPFSKDPRYSCSMEDGAYVCSDGTVCGRPFLVSQVHREALAISRGDWNANAFATQASDNNSHDSVATRALALTAEHWTKIALMEHASIAAFARFQLQLLSLGAPAELVEATNQALQDETKHARWAFALASRFRGENIGPGPLSIESALAEDSIESILTTTILEGCVGETLAALEAQAALADCQDAEVRKVLLQIAEDESQHAALAWRTVQWLLNQEPELIPLATGIFEQVLSKPQVADSTAHSAANSPEPTGAPSTEHTAQASNYGVLSPNAATRVHAQALNQVVAPCANRLLSALSSSTNATQSELAPTASPPSLI